MYINALWLIPATSIGCIIGVVIMCMLQISRDREEDAVYDSIEVRGQIDEQ
jgi:hypothetical protein